MKKLNRFFATYILVALSLLLLTACGGGGGGGEDTSGNNVARIVIKPKSTLLTQLNDTHQLTPQVFNAAGVLLDKDVTWSTSNPDSVTVDAQGLLTSMGTIGSASITAEVGGIRSAPVAVLVALPALNSRFINDDQVVGNFTLVDPESIFAPGAQYQVTLMGIDTPDVGDILLAREDQPLSGRVVDVQENNGELVVTLEVLRINELFTDLKINQTFSATKEDITISKAADDYYTVERLADDRYIFTLRPGAQAATKSSFVAREGIQTRALAIGTVANRFYPFNCEFSGPSFSGDNAIFSLTGLSPTITLQSPPPEVDIIYESSMGGLQQVILQGEVEGSFTMKTKFTAELEGKAECKIKLLEINFPFPGALAPIIGVQTPVGLGFDAGGKITLADMELGATLTAKMDAEIGLICPGGTNCSLDGSYTPSGELTPIIDLSPASDLTADLKFEPELSGFGYTDLTFGNPIFSSWRVTLANLQAGVKQSGNLALVSTQIADATYASDYQLSMEFSAKPGSDVTSFFNLLGLPGSLSEPITASTPLASSPTAAAPVAESITADVDDFIFGDTVNFTVKLDPATINFLPTIYNVNKVFIYQNAGTPELVASATASDDQTEFNLSWVATNVGTVTDNFYAFVSTDLLPVPLLDELELGKVVPMPTPVPQSILRFIRYNYLLETNASYGGGADLRQLPGVVADLAGLGDVGIASYISNADSTCESDSGSQASAGFSGDNISIRFEIDAAVLPNFDCPSYSASTSASGTLQFNVSAPTNYTITASVDYAYLFGYKFTSTQGVSMKIDSHSFVNVPDPSVLPDGSTSVTETGVFLAGDHILDIKCAANIPNPVFVSGDQGYESEISGSCNVSISLDGTVLEGAPL